LSGQKSYSTNTVYQKEALRLLINEANSVIAVLQLQEKCPITEADLVGMFVLPFETAQMRGAVGKVVTRNYAYYVSKENKLCYIEGTSQEQDFRRWQAQYRWPVTSEPFQTE